MKKKLLITLIFATLIICTLAISVSAASLSKFAPVDLTLTDGQEVTAYIAYQQKWDNYLAYQRDNLYIDYKDTSAGKYAWENVKVFDMRNTDVYTYDGTTLAVLETEAVECLIGTDCNSKAKNVTHFYMPKGAIVLENSFFSASWTSLEYVYVTNTIIKIYQDSFVNSPVKTIEFQENSQLKTIGILEDNSGKGAFQGCTNLKTIQLPEGLEKIGRNSFYNTGLSGTIVIPNSVTNVYAGAFLATKIDTIYFGDGPVTIGYNQLGENTSIKNIYLSTQTVITNPANTWKFTHSDVNFYVVGNGDNSNIISQLKQSVNRPYAQIVTKEEAENGNAHTAVIETSVDLCQAFYKGNHIYEATCEYADGFMKNGCFGQICTRANCGMNDVVETAPIFKGLGFSTDGRSYLCGFSVNNKALTFYNENSENDIAFYGLVAMAQANAYGDKAINPDATAMSNKVVNINYFDKNFDIFELSVKNVNTMPDAKFYATAYYIVKEENGENKVMYFNLYNKEYKEENLLKNPVSYNLLSQ